MWRCKLPRFCVEALILLQCFQFSQQFMRFLQPEGSCSGKRITYFNSQHWRQCHPLSHLGLYPTSSPTTSLVRLISLGLNWITMSHTPLLCHLGLVRRLKWTFEKLSTFDSVLVIFTLVPTRVLKDCSELLAPAITSMSNLSMSTGTLPSSWKDAIVLPSPKSGKKKKLIMENYHPISNLPFISKLCEKIVAMQLTDHLLRNNLMEPFQSAYRPNHSVGAALLRICNDILHLYGSKEDNGSCVTWVICCIWHCWPPNPSEPTTIAFRSNWSSVWLVYVLPNRLASVCHY